MTAQHGAAHAGGSTAAPVESPATGQDAHEVRRETGSPETADETRADRIRSLIILGVIAALGAAVVVGAFGIGVGSPTAPGAGLWPAIIGSIWCLAGIISAVGAARGAVLPSIRPGSPLLGIGLVVVFILLFSYVDLAVAVLVVSLLWMLLLSDRPWPSAIISSVAITAVIYAVFVFAVGTPLPASLLPTF